jgi:pimeloyl-ACP methyl ester carboxylesterase
LRRKLVVLIPSLIAAGAVALIIGVYFLQQWGTFPAPPASAGRPEMLSAARGESLWLELDGSRVECWLLPGAGAGAGRAPLLMYTHGNGEFIDFWADKFDEVRAAGIHVLLVEYPGYGRSGGKPSEPSVTATLVAAYDRLAADPRIDAGRIFGYGRSLGGGAMAQLAARRPLAALVLESTFTSLADMLHGYHVPDWLIRNRFDTRAVLANFERPVLVLHGNLDEVIPVAHARALKAAARNGELHLQNCGHNNCPRQWELVLRFLGANGVINRPEGGKP